MKNRFATVVNATIATLLLSIAYSANATTYNVVTQYGADNTGVNDCTTAIQNAINAAGAGSGNIVYLPAGTYLVAGNGLSIQNTNNLTFEGAGTASTMIWYTRAKPHGFTLWYNTNVTLQNFSTDVQKVSGQYDLGITQGTITSVNTATKTITVQVESGYPLLNRPDLQAAPSKGWAFATLWTLSDPKRLDFDGILPTMTTITPSPDGTTATIALQSIPQPLFVGEKYMIGLPSGGLWLDAGYGNSGTTTLQNINYYGGGVNWMGDADGNTGAFNMTNVYCGPPSYQSDRALTCNQGWAMSNNNRATITISNSTFLQTWDDVIDIGSNSGAVGTQPQANQIIVGPDKYLVGDKIELIDDTDPPYGTIYTPSNLTVTAVTPGNNNDTLTLNQNITVKNPNQDLYSDLTLAGPVILQNDTFNNTTGRHVAVRSGISVLVQNCTFKDDTPLILGGLGGEGPINPSNITVTGCTFIDAQGVNVAQPGINTPNGAPATASSNTNVSITNNRFIHSGRLAFSGQFDYYHAEPLGVSNVTGAIISNNWFDDNWGANASFAYDTNLKVSNNTFVHPNKVNPSWASPQDTSVIWMHDITGATLSGNIVYGAGPYTTYLNNMGANVSGVTGAANGIIDIDNPLGFYLAYDSLVIDRPSSGTILDQAAWTGGSSQKWSLLPDYAVPGSFTVNDSGNGRFIGNGNSTNNGANIVEENQSWTTGNPTSEQVWSLSSIDNNTDNILNNLSNDAINVLTGTSSPGAKLGQWGAGNSQNQNFYTVTPPTASATQQFGTDVVDWSNVPYATSYSVGRSTTSGGSYATIATNLATGPYIDSGLSNGTKYYYVVTAAGLPISNNQSNETLAIPNGTYVPVNIAAAYNVNGIEPDGWNYQGNGYDGSGFTYSSNLTGNSITWSGDVFPLGSTGKPNAVGDAGQRINLPNGSYSNLLILGSYLGTGPTSTGTFQPTITYADGSSTVLSQGMTNWCGTAGEPGESNAATYTYRDQNNGGRNTINCYIHGYSIALNPAKRVAWIDLPTTGNFRLLAMDLGGANLSTLPSGQNLLPGQYVISPSDNCFLTQLTNGNLVLYAGSNPNSHGAILWQSGVNGTTPPYYTAMQTDGNLVTYAGTPTSPGAVQWSAGIYNQPGEFLTVNDSMTTQLNTGTTVSWQEPYTIAPGGFLSQNQYIVSPNDAYFLIQQTDGNLVLYNGNGPGNVGSVVWGSANYQSQGIYYTQMQTDGNLVTYPGTPANPGTSEWASNSYGHPGDYLALLNTPSVQVTNGSTAAWQKP